MPTLYILGTSPGDPGTISIDAIRCIKKSDVVIAGDPSTEEFLKNFITPEQKCFTKRSDEGVIKLCGRLLNSGKNVSFVSYGNPFLFEGIGEELRKYVKGCDIRVVSMPSAIDGMLCAMLEYVQESTGLRIATPESLYAGIPLDSRIPTFLFCLDDAIKNKRLAAKLQRHPLTYYPGEHQVRGIMLMKKGEAKISLFKLKDLSRKLSGLQL